MKNEYRKYSAVMILCFILGGFSIMLFLFQAYDAVWRTEAFNASRPENFSAALNRTFESNRSFERGPIPANPLAFLASPFSVVILLNGIILLAGGISLWKLTCEKELTHAKDRLKSLLLLPEERAIIDELKKSRGSLTQSQLVRNMGMSKVKVHRVVSKLAAKGIVKKYEYGLTNKIVLQEEV